ncbi:MAG: pyridoxamine 5'-phosphate oxidase family protein, partial [Chloroflexi bacterium]|nr:pyridoxamine 5'-phosphate oxidase family protein [Chloroflexota bacterium]
SPCEFFIWEGDLFLGMMWQSRKALDLLRDPRCVVHSAVIDKNDPAGEFKLRGKAVDVRDPATVERYCHALKEATGWRPEGPFHLFGIDIDHAVHIKYLENGDQYVMEWQPGQAEQERLRRWTGSGVVD